MNSIDCQWLKEKEDYIKQLEEENKLLKENVEELEKIAKSWMEDYDRLKNKYEPSMLVLSEEKSLSEKD